MKTNLISLTVTIVATICIVIMGYKGITYAGEQVIKNNKEIIEIEEDKHLKYMFYSEMDEVIQVFPWNYYDENEAKNLNDESYEWLKDDKILAGIEVFTSGYISSQLGIEEVDWEDINKKLKPKKKDIKKITVESKIEEYLFYEKEIKVNENITYQIKYVLTGNGDMIAFFCHQLEDIENPSEKLKEDEIRSTLEAKITDVEEAVQCLDFFRYNRLLVGTEFFSNLYDMFKGDIRGMRRDEFQDNLYDEVGISSEKTEKEKMEKKQMAEEKWELEKDRLLSEYQIIVLSDRILVIAEDRNVILYYSREECKLIGFSLT